VTPEEDALLRVVGALERLDVQYMVTGSVASSFHGRPRATNDSDIVIDPGPEQVRRLAAELVSLGFSVDLTRALDSLRRRLSFNAIETTSASKIDLIIRKDRPFSHEELRRRLRVPLWPDTKVAMASPEDSVLSKLEWAMKAGGSEKQLQDAAGVVEVNPGLDRPYVEKWARELKVLDLWRRIGGS
jgi:hypothetical protein